MLVNQQEQPQSHFTITECARFLNVSRKTVERELVTGGLTGVYRYGPGGGRIVRITAESIKGYFQPMQSIATVDGRG